MEFREATSIALQSLWANKLRSVLTLLGVVIGIAAVIAVVTFINGINSYVAERIFNLGADVFIVNKQPNVITNVDQWLEAQKRKNITFEDYEAVRDGCHACTVIGASVGGGTRGKVRYGTQSIEDTGLRGWTPSMARIYDLDLIAGRIINDADMKNASAVVVVGHDIFENLLTGTDSLNKEVRVDGRVYRVIGVGKKEGKTLGQSRDNWVMFPITTFFKVYGGPSKNSVRIWGKANATGAPLVNAMDEARVILRSRRHDRPGAKDTFEIDTNQSFLSIWANISSTFFLVTVFIASISLVVGGIVIMNMMLVSVTERTREIGVRKALGAKRTDVLSQFMIETTTIAAVGGLVGIIGGIIVAKGVTGLIGMPSRVETWSVFAGLFVASAVGIISGVYPAWKAAKLDPIVALRSEL
jgi:putative ABC transport system permease protein